MSDAPEAASLRLQIEIAVPMERAFQVFTQEFDRIKPRDHTLLEVEIEETVLEPWAGGRVYDRGVDGTTCQWGRVLSVDPPHAIVFTWDISPHWQVQTDPALTSEVEVRFSQIEAGRTLVSLEHRHLDHHGAGWPGMEQALRGSDGWPRWLDRYRKLSS